MMTERSSSHDALCSARLSFAKELEAGILTERDLTANPKLLDVFRPRPVPSLSVRVAQRLAMKAGWRDFDSGFLGSVRSARRALLGSIADAPPRFLVRVDEFPDSRALDDSRERWRSGTRMFHQAMRTAGVPYLMALVPQYAHGPLDPTATGGEPLDHEDRALIEQMRRDGVAFAQHGTTHRTRYRDPRRRSELCGLAPQETTASIADGLERLAHVAVVPRVYVPPFNRFDASQFPLLARHFDVIGGGPESVPLIGFHGGPLWRGNAVFLPCYPPVYATAAALIPVIDRLVSVGPGTWIPIVLHVSWEIGDGFESLRSLARKLAPYAARWDEFLEAVDMSRAPGDA